MIHLDRRVGSIELLQPLRKRGLDVAVTTLASADIAWCGRGFESRPVQCGVEVKSLMDMLTCVKDGRFAGRQLREMRDSYDCCYLVVEGATRERVTDGALMRRRGSSHRWESIKRGGGVWTWAAYRHYLSTVRFRGGFHLVEVEDREHGTAGWVAAEYTWWRKPYEQHDALRTFVDTKLPRVDPTHDAGARGADAEERKLELTMPSLYRRLVAQLPGIDWKLSARLEKMFKAMGKERPSVEDALRCSEYQLTEVEGIGVGKAAAIRRALLAKV